MSILSKTIYGDFLDGYIYSDFIFLHTIANELVIIDSKKTDTKELVLDDILKKGLLHKCFQMNQFMTDFDIYKNNLYYCNSDGVFCLDYRGKSVELQERKSNKLWDAKIQCVKAGENGRIAMSAAEDGLFELDTEMDGKLFEVERRVERNIHQITSKHSTSCKWTYGGSIWNNSIINHGSLFEFSIQKDSIERQQISYVGEHLENEIFAEMLESSYITISERTKTLYRFADSFMNVVRFSKSKNKKIHFNELMTFDGIGINQSGKLYDVAEIYVNRHNAIDSLLVFENNKGIQVVERNGELRFTLGPIEEIVKWRVFPHSNKYKSTLLVVMDDRVEVITFD